MTDIDTNRSEFEEWFLSGCTVNLTRSGDGYAFMAANSAWETWQAARAALTSNITDLTDIATRMNADLDARETQIAGLNAEINRQHAALVEIKNSTDLRHATSVAESALAAQAPARCASPELTAQINAAAKSGRLVFEPGWNEPIITLPLIAEAARDDGPDLSGTHIPAGDSYGSALDQLYAAFHREPCGDTLAAIGCAIQELQAIQPDQRVDDLAALVRRLVHSLSKAAPDNDLPAKAVDYLQRKGLQGSPLRDAASKRDDVAGDEKELCQLIKDAFEFTKYAACIRWSEHECNTKDWLDGFEVQLEDIQGRLQAAIAASKKDTP